MVRFRLTGDYPPGDVRVVWSPDDVRPRFAEVETLIDAAWRRASARPGVRLFDGPMCRLDGFDPGLPLVLRLSPTNYKAFLGTNMAHPEIADRFGSDALANPVGVSPALETADGYLLLGRRNAAVAYYPNRVHPFSGSLEPRPGGDVFAEVMRELGEELGFVADDVSEMRLTGIAEDAALRQPELIFRVRSTRPRAAIEATLDAGEHTGAYAIPAEQPAVGVALDDPALTPVARAALMLWGRARWGQAWFDEAVARAGGYAGREH